MCSNKEKKYIYALIQEHIFSKIPLPPLKGKGKRVKGGKGIEKGGK